MEYMYRSMVIVLGIALLLLPNTFLFAQAPDTLWTKIYHRDSDDRAYSIQQTADSGYFIAASTSPDGATHDVWLLKTDANGDTLWTRTYGGQFDDRCFEAQRTSDNGFILTGRTRSFGAGDADVWLLKTDSLGDTLWTRTYGGDHRDMGQSVRETQDDCYVVTGYTESFGAGSGDVWLIKTDSLGDTLWTRTYGGASYEAAQSVQQTSDKGYIMAGLTDSSGSWDAYLIKTDSLGDMLWTKIYGGFGDDFFESVQQTFDNGYIITGFTASYGQAGDLYLIKTDENGDTLWTRHWGNAHNIDYGYSVIQIPDSNYIVAGYYNNNTPDVWLLKVDRTGDTLWTAIYGRYAGYYCDEWAYAVQRTFDGGYILAGKTGDWVFGDIYLIKMASETIGVKENHTTNLPMPNLEVYPNPFRKKTGIRYQLPDNNDVNVVIYDVSGRLVKAITCPTPNALRPTLITWDGRDDADDKLPSGIYFLRFHVNEYVETVKLLLVR